MFFAIHVGRVDAEWTRLGLLTPAVATAGDMVARWCCHVVVLCRSNCSSPREPARRAGGVAPHAERSAPIPTALERARRALWAEQRLRRSVARDLENNTLIGAVRQLVRAGLPITAVLIAVNPVWGFSWYFNSENWASAAWQKIAESRVDDWREAMIDAAVRRPGRGRVTAPGVFDVAPRHSSHGDFSFVVIGDPGEGDPSQHALSQSGAARGRA